MSTVFDNYTILNWYAVGPKNHWRNYQHLIENKISGIRRYVSFDELTLMCSLNYRRPPSRVICTTCDSRLRSDGSCPYGCKRKDTTVVKLIASKGYVKGENTPNPQSQPGPINWALNLLGRPSDSWVILDTETTGFSGIDEVIEISVIDGAGNVLVQNKRFKPKCEISQGAQEVHGISAEMLADAPDFSEFAEELGAILHKRRIVIYNSNFDIRMLTQTAVIHNCLKDIVYDDVTCAMLQYAAFVGEIKRGGGGYRWQALPGGDHSSLGDCQAVLRLIKRMAGQHD